MEIKTRVYKQGSSYAVLIPKALIDCKILIEGEEYIFTVKESVNECGLHSFTTQMHNIANMEA